jgi:imidazolonepropionase-like amidohydrolase
MQLLAEAGVPTSRLLLAATRNAADALGAGRRLGRVAPGFEADLLVLDANPLADILHTRAIHAVVLDGQLLTADTLENLKGEQP